MRKAKRKRLEGKGWKIGTVKEFLGLSDEESAYIDLKIKLATGLRERRRQKGLSQLDLAAKRNAVVEDEEIQPRGVDGDLTVWAYEPRRAKGPLLWDDPVEHRGAGGHFVELEGC